MSKALQKLDVAELEALSTSIQENGSKICAALFPDRPRGHESVIEMIHEWAINRKMVLESRANGNADIALIFDKICHRLWQKLPGYAQRIRLDIDHDMWKEPAESPLTKIFSHPPR